MRRRREVCGGSKYRGTPGTSSEQSALGKRGYRPTGSAEGTHSTGVGSPGSRMEGRFLGGDKVPLFGAPVRGPSVGTHTSPLQHCYLIQELSG